MIRNSAAVSICSCGITSLFLTQRIAATAKSDAGHTTMPPFEKLEIEMNHVNEPHGDMRSDMTIPYPLLGSQT